MTSIRTLLLAVIAAAALVKAASKSDDKVNGKERALQAEERANMLERQLAQAKAGKGRHAKLGGGKTPSDRKRPVREVKKQWS